MKYTLKVRDQKPGEVCTTNTGGMSETAARRLLETVLNDHRDKEHLILLTVEVTFTEYVVIPDQPEAADPAPDAGKANDPRLDRASVELLAKHRRENKAADADKAHAHAMNVLRESDARIAAEREREADPDAGKGEGR